MADGKNPNWLQFWHSTYVGNIVYECSSGDQGGICKINVDGLGYQWLAEGYDPQISPDGQKILFERNSDQELWLMNADGTEQKKIITGGFSDVSWSPDSSRIIYLIFSGNYLSGDYYVIASSGAERVKIEAQQPSLETIMYLQWSPDGKWLIAEVEKFFEEASVYAKTLYLFDPSTGKYIKSLLPEYIQGIAIYDPVIAWSSDTFHGVFPCAETKAPNLVSICYLAVDGSFFKMMKGLHGNVLIGVPDGLHAAFAPCTLEEKKGICVSDFDGNNIHLVAEYDIDKVDDKFSWAFDGSRLVFETPDGIYMVNIDGSGLTQLTNSSSDKDPRWAP